MSDTRPLTNPEDGFLDRPLETPEDDAPVQIAIRRRKPAKTAPVASETPKTPNSDTEGAVKINFKGKKPTRPTPVSNSVKIVKKRKISVSFEEPEPEIEPLETPTAQDLDLDEVFGALEQGASSENLFADFDNPLDHFADAPAKHPTPEPELSVQDNIPSEPSEKPSPFISFRVDKRPLSGARPAAPQTNFIAEKDFTGQEPKQSQKHRLDFTQQPAEPPLRGDLGGLKKPKSQSQPVTTAIAAAPKKTSSTIGLLIAILLTVIAGGFVGALIYFWFFQE